MNAIEKRSYQSGFTLIELLVALVLGLGLTAGITNIYLENKKNYIQDEELARLQENGRYAINMLKRELTMAGFVAGIPDLDDIPVASVTKDCAASDWALDVSVPFDFLNQATTGSTPISKNDVTWTCLENSNIVDTSDIFSVKRTADRKTLDDGVLGVQAEDDKQWYFRAYDYKADIGWSYLGASQLIPVADKTPGSLIDYWEYYVKVFYLRDYSRTEGDNIPTLCISQLDGDEMTSNCLVEGIEDIQLEIGIDSNGDFIPDLFVADPTKDQLANIVSVRLYMLVRSVQPISGYVNEKSFTLGTKNVAAKNDGFMRRVFTTTVQMRNATLPNA